ncbi:hypothetical protein BH11PSE13_BH11PSE13_32300 [soil metagenome]
MAPTSASTPDPADGVAPASESHALNFPVVGLGASAGGIESLTRLFGQMPGRPGMAFVVILHLSPSHESNAAAIVQRVTDIPCVQVTKSTRVEVDHIYFIPPGFDLLMDDGHLRPVPREQLKGPHLAIDLFFRTLASVHRERAVCVVLSGTGSDGAVGLTRIKEMGGVTLAQTPEDAGYDSMPLSAIATGMVDIVLPAVDMAQRLIDLWANAQRIRLPDAEKISPLVNSLDDSVDAQRAESALQEVMTLLRNYTQHDFRHYKRATVLRRIERRLQVNRLADLPAYRDFLHAHPDESGPLLQDMLISVTNFFRDRESFEALEREVIPQIVESKGPGDPVRAWVAGCATGEEAYSLSILLNEHAAQQLQAVDVQIFATDIDERAIGVARKGLYPDGIIEDVPPSRLRNFFVKELHQYRVAGSVREPVLFAVHNLLRDPPFSRLDLICCRNLLIYLDRNAQAHVLEMFRVALKPGGYLFLGTSESADVVGSLFTAIDKKHRIYRVNPQVPPARHLPLISDLPMERSFAAQAAGRNAMRQKRPAFAELHQRALEQFSPPSVLIDAQHNVLHLSNGVGRFLGTAAACRRTTCCTTCAPTSGSNCAPPCSKLRRRSTASRRG